MIWGISLQSFMRPWHTQPHGKDWQRPSVTVAGGIGIGVGIEVATHRPLDTDADSDPDAGIGDISSIFEAVHRLETGDGGVLSPVIGF